VYRPSEFGGSDDYSPNVRWVSPVNVNTAPAPVIAAVLAGSGLGQSTSLTGDQAWTLAKILVDYRNGVDNVDGISSNATMEYTGHSAGTNNPDDNPFDGWDGHRDRGTLPGGPGWDDESVTVVANYAVLDPYVTVFRSDGVDNSGDGFIDEDADGRDNDEDRTTDEGNELMDPYIFPGGHNGFAELEAVLDSDPSAPHPLFGGSRDILNYIKANASLRRDIDFDENGSLSDWERGCWTTPFRYDSTHWLILCEGVVGHERRAVARVMSVVGF
jgi:hypothetical protein